MLTPGLVRPLEYLRVPFLRDNDFSVYNLPTRIFFAVLWMMVRSAVSYVSDMMVQDASRCCVGAAHVPAGVANAGSPHGNLHGTCQYNFSEVLSSSRSVSLFPVKKWMDSNVFVCWNHLLRCCLVSAA